MRDSKWSDGSWVTAKDFERSWKSLLRPEFVAHFNSLKFLKNGEKAFSKNCSVEDVGVSARDDKTLIVELEKPDPAFLDTICDLKYYPVHASICSSEIKDPGSIITSGPFSLKNYTIQDKIILEKNSYFYDAKKIALEEIYFFIIKNNQTALFMFENKELDFFSEVITKIVPHAIPSLTEQNQFQKVDSAGTVFLFLNTQKFPLTNANIRKALAYAIDRASIMKNILHMDSPALALGIIPKSIKKDLWHPLFQDYDIQKAKTCFDKGLEELKITKEEFPSITIMNISTGSPGVMEVIKQMWESALGCHVNIQNFETAIYISRLRSKNFEIGRIGKRIDINDPSNF